MSSVALSTRRNRSSKHLPEFESSQSRGESSQLHWWRVDHRSHRAVVVIILTRNRDTLQPRPQCGTSQAAKLSSTTPTFRLEAISSTDCDLLFRRPSFFLRPHISMQLQQPCHSRVIPETARRGRFYVRDQHWPKYQLSPVCLVYECPNDLTQLRSLASLNSEKSEDQRHIVLSRDTSLLLELEFNTGPSHVLFFDALEIPFTQSVRYAVKQNDRRLLSLRILLVDALTGMFMRVDEWPSEPLLVDFQAEENIIDLRNGKAIVRFTLPCCFLGPIHRTGRYR